MSPRHPAAPLIETLEARILYSADLMPAAPAGQEQHVLDATRPALGHVQLFFVDARVDGYRGLIADIAGHGGATSEIVVIGADEDGLARIDETLAGRQQIAEMHIVSHGESGAVQLGATRLDDETLLRRAPEIAAWGSALGRDGDILLYGCDVAAGPDGETFVDQLAALTGADVAASANLTGSAALGGDWNLEYRVGTIEGSLSASAWGLDAWQGVLATFTVRNTADSGADSLRQAILDANASAGSDQIVFNIPGTGVHTIILSALLPDITDTVNLDATTDDSFAANGGKPAVVLDGANLNGTGLRLTSTADGSTIRGLVIENFRTDGITIDSGSSGNTIAGNFIGSLSPSGGSGGTGNSGAGVFVMGDNNTVGGTSTTDRNIISGNANGIVIGGVAATGNHVIGNYIGSDYAGTTGIANTFDGVRMQVGATANVIGGSTLAEHNVIAASGDDGIDVAGETSDNNILKGNWIGITANGSSMLGTGGDGIYINGGADGTVVGGSGAYEGNWIAGSFYIGVELDGTTSGTQIVGNRIGTDAAGTANWGTRENGVLLENAGGGNGPSGNLVDGNIIAFSGQGGVFTAGIDISGATATDNAVLRNRIYASVGLGIDLEANGVTANDAGDTDGGANNLQNTPMLSAATSSASGTLIGGTLNSNANTSYRIEFFTNSPSNADASSHGEAYRYLGYTTVTTDASGNASFNANLANTWVNHGDRVSATATVDLGGGQYGSTSEFALNVTATASGVVVVDTTSDVADGTTTSIANLGNARGADGLVSLREAILAANATANAGTPDKIVFAIPGSGIHTLTLGSLLPSITDALALDASTDDSFAANQNKPALVLDGNNLNGSGLVLSASADGSSIRGLVIQNFQGSAIRISNGSDGNTVAGNYIGSVSASGSAGGTGNGGDGILVQGANNIIGGSSAADRNIVSGNANGIIIDGNGANGNQVVGNYIGTDAGGTVAIANTFDGVRISGGASGNSIGGSNANQRNIVSGNGQDGIQIDNEASDGNSVKGNWVGLGADGTTVLGSGGDGIFVSAGADNSVIGGAGATDGNWIAGVTLVGIEIDGASTGTLVQGNRIGTDLAGTANWGSHENGIMIENTVGGSAPANNSIIGNTIAFSGQGNVFTTGIKLQASAGNANSFLQNSVYASVGLGIDLGGNGVSLNDTGDADSGPNNLLNFPLLALAKTNGSGQITIGGSFNGAANSYFRLEFFATSGADATGYGEGQTYLGFVNVATDGSGNASFSTTLGASVPVGSAISATATKADATYSSFTDTSEFARAIVAISAAQGTLVVDTATDVQDGDVSSLSTLLANKGADGLISLREAIAATNATANGTAGADLINFAIPGTGVHTITLSSLLPSITDTVKLDATTDDSFAANGGKPAIVLDGANLAGDGLTLGSTADGSTIRGLVITHFQGKGINIQSGADGNTIAGNYIGKLTASGTAGSNTLGQEGISVAGANNTIGGLTAADRNVIAGAAGRGILLSGATATGNLIAGNYIGVAADGLTALGNGNWGIDVSSGANGTIIGGTTAASRNVIAGNAHGIAINSSQNVVVQGNAIGVAADGATLLGNGTFGGVYIGSATTGTLIGGSGTGNQIAGNEYGVILASGTSRATVLGNSIHGNTNLGIDLWTEGVTPNDTGDADTGANNLQNFPVLTLARTDGSGQVSVSGTLNSSAGSYYRIEFFASPAADATGYGEGKIYLGFANVATDASGNAGFAATLAASVPIGYFISATATKSDAAYASFTDTSEFARAVVAISATQGTLVVDTATDVLDGDTTSLSTLLANKGTDGLISLREAITAANNTANGTAGADRIGFAIPGTGAQTITLAYDGPDAGTAIDGLPVLTGATILDATSQPGYAGTPLVVLNGNGVLADGFELGASAGGSTIRGLVISNFQLNGIHVSSGANGNTIAGNYIGKLTPAGTAGTAGNSLSGIAIYSNNNVIGGTAPADRNVISGNSSNGIIFFSGASGNQIIGNYIGTDAAGAAAIGNALSGISIQGGATGNLIGGSLPAQRNVISGNSSSGIYVATATNNQIFGNYIGTDATGSNTLVNSVSGISLLSGATGNLIGAAGLGNIIVGDNNSDGIVVSGTAAGNPVQGNWIGLAADGVTVLGSSAGIYAPNGAGNFLIGGSGAGQGNVIVGARTAGISLDAASSGVIIRGNFIGTDSSLTLAGGNLENGIFLSGSAFNNTIGGTGANDGNWIANTTTYDGIHLAIGSGAGNAILGNRFWNNGQLAFDIGSSVQDGFGVTANDAGDADSGGNGLQNFPVLTQATTDTATQITLAGTLNSTAGSHFRIEFFASAGADPSGHGEGRTYLGYVNVVTNGSGTAAFSTTLNVAVSAGQFISATATKSDATYSSFTDTSEFAANIVAHAAPINALPGPATVAEDTPLALGGLSVGDADGDLATLMLGVANGTLSVSLAGGASISAGSNGSAMLTLAGSQAQLNAALASLSYQGALNFNGSDTLNIVATDAAGLSDSDSLAIAVTAVNDAPANAVPAAQSLGEDTSLVFSAGNGNRLSISDIDAGNAILLVSLDVANGALSLSGSAGLSFSLGDGAADRSMSFSGTVDAINAALAGLSYAPDANFNGSDTLTLGTSDLGSTGSGGTMTDSDTVTIAITAANDAPTLVNGANVGLAATDENTVSTPLAVSSLLASAGWADADAGAFKGVAITAAGGSGSWQYSTNGVTWTNFASVAASNALLLADASQIRYVPNGSNGETASLAFKAWDQTAGSASLNGAPSQADPGAGGGGTAYSSAEATASLLVAAVNDAPVITSNGGGSAASISLAENTGVVTTVTASDVDLPAQTPTFSIGGADAGHFTIDANTGELAFNSPPDYDSPADSDGNNIYEVTVTVSDGSLSDSQNLSIGITPLNDNAPLITSNGGAPTANINVAENNLAVTTVSATDADLPGQTLSYSIMGGVDAGLFSLDSNTGALSFLVAPDFEVPADSGGDNTYELIVQVSDGSLTDSQSIALAVTNQNDNGAGPIGDSNAAANTLPENAAASTAAGITAHSVDPDVGDSISYTLDNDAGGRFAIDANSGVVTVANGSLLDYEAATSHNIVVRATSADGSFTTANFTVSLSDVNEFAVSAVSDADATANTVAENAANGTLVGLTAFAADADATTNTVSYSLSDDAGGRFAIDASSGVVTVADGSRLDFEAATSHGITVVATSADGSTSSQAFTINLSDVNEFAVSAVSDADATANSISENAANATLVGLTAAAFDADGGTNTIAYSLDNDAGGRFAIDANSGVVRVADGSRLDFEAATSHNILVRATSADGSFATANFTIGLSDSNEFALSPVSDADVGANTVAENVANGTSVGITAFASDADATSNAVSYSLSDDAGGRFAIDANSGVVMVANGSLLDYEAATSHDITVVATSADGSTSSQVFTVSLSDVNEFAVSAVSDADASANVVAENAVNGTLVGLTAFAADADATNNTVSYSLDNDAGGRFAIDVNSGVVTVANGSLLDYEAATSHAILVRATSADGSFTTVNFTIGLSDVNEFAVSTVSDADATANTVAENAANGTLVGITAFASDADATSNAVSYSLSNSAGGRFAIDANSGMVSVANGSLLDYEATTSHSITVVATSADGSTSSHAFTISLSDVNEFAVSAVSDADATTNSVTENAANGTLVGLTALAADADATTNAVTYSLSDDAGGRFAIDVNSGVVTVADGSRLDYEAASSHGITVVATSADGSTSSQAFTISLSDVNEFAVSAISDADATANSISENAANASVVGLTAAAFDADGSTNTIAYSLDNDAGGRFAIDATTGVVTVADGSRLDYESAASHAILVRATSSDGSFTTANFTIDLSPVNDNAPVITSDGGGATATVNVAENISAVTALSASDADLPSQALSYRIIGGADAARFAIDAGSGALSLVAAPDYEAPADSDGNNIYEVVVEVSDGALTGTQALAVSVFNGNETPATGPVVLAAITEDSGSRLITQAELLANASDIDGPALTATALSVASGNGSLLDNGDGSWLYTPAPNDDGAVGFAYLVTDGSLAAAGTASLDITPVNDAPTISGAPTALAGTDESTPSIAISGTELLFAAAWHDPDAGAGKGLAIIGSSGLGTWQYSTDGIVWSAVGPASTTDALLLDEAAMLRYLPDGVHGETVSLGFVAWDKTTGSASANGQASHANASTNAGGAFSTASATATITVTVTAAAANAPDSTTGTPPLLPATPTVPAQPTISAISMPALATPSVIALPPVPQAPSPQAPQAIDAAKNAAGDFLLMPTPTTAHQAAAPFDASPGASSEVSAGTPADTHASRRWGYSDSQAQFRLPTIPFLLLPNPGFNALTQIDVSMAQSTYRAAVDSSSQPEESDQEIEQRFGPAGAIGVTGALFSAGVVWWTIRAGGLMASLALALPAWRNVDPLSIVGRPADDPDDATDWGVDPDADDEGRRDEHAVSGMLEELYEPRP